MGRIKTKQIKRISNELMDAHESEFTNDFRENRGKISTFASIKSKKLTNVIAGYVTRLSRKAD